MNLPATAATTPVFKQAGLRETVLLLAIAWLIPFAVHLAPWAGERPLGAYLLPMFWVTFVAVYFYGAGLGLLVGLFAPAVNLLVTGLPAWKFLSMMSFELAIYALVTASLVRCAPRFWLLAPLGYLVAKAGSTLLQTAASAFGDTVGPRVFFAHAIMGGLTGIGLLTAINAALVRFYPKTKQTVD